VEPETFKDLYGIEEKDMDKAACGFCQDQIRSVYGGRSKELKTFQRVIRNLGKG
jgi:ribosomal protein L34E